MDPKDIKYIPKIDFAISSQDEKVAGGDWDLGLELFDENTLVYLAYKDIFVDGKDWGDTKFYNGPYKAGIERVAGYEGMVEDEVKTWMNLRCGYLTYIFRAMRQFGYQQDPYSDFVSLIIGRNGEVILNNGRHRLAAAKILNIPIIPVLIDVRHSKWLDFKIEVLKYSTQHGNGVYAPLKHVDLDDIPHRQEDRSQVVVDSISPDTKTVVDLGANWGRLCQSLEDTGRDCVAVEFDDTEFSFLERIRDIHGYRYEICKEDICDFIDQRNKFDCVLALSIFHHLAKTKIGHARMLGLLRKLDCNEMIFQMPLDAEMKLIEDLYKNYTDKEFCELIVKNSCLSKYREIGGRENRKMYHFVR
jgi:2-polyprenyl-3-methyl-5-hydroxy-6-metoxy-1,4-benzoquinol methylase